MVVPPLRTVQIGFRVALRTRICSRNLLTMLASAIDCARLVWEGYLADVRGQRSKSVAATRART